MRSSCVGSGPRAGAKVRSAGSTRSATVVTVAVDPRVCCVGSARVVSAVCANRVVVTGHARAASGVVVVARGTGVTVAGSTVGAVSAVSSGSVSTVGGSSAVVTVAVDTRVGSICNPRAMRSVGALGVVVAGCHV